MEEQDIVKKASQGDDEAFITLMYQHKVALYRTALSYLKNEADAVEAIQEVTARAYQKIHTLRNPAYAKTWLIKVMMNYCNDVIKNSKRMIVSETKILGSSISDDYTYLEVEEAMARLTKEERNLIHLKYLHDFKIKEIAAMTATPEGTVKTRLYRIVKKLRLFMEEKGGRQYE